MLPHYENRANDYFAFEWHSPHPWSLHLHPQLEILYVEEGEIDVTVDFQTRRLRNGDVAVAFPHCVHGYEAPDGQRESGHFCGLVIMPELAGDFCELLSQHFPHQPFLTADKLSEESRYALRQLFAEREHFRPLVAKSYLQLLLACIWPALEAVPDNDQHQKDTPHQAIRYVMEHYRQPLQAKEVAAALHISPSHLARIFSTRLHMGFNEYVNRLRVQTAQSLLRSTNHPITDIMLDTGFESQSTFNRAFREIHGVSPREYRLQFRQK